MVHYFIGRRQIDRMLALSMLFSLLMVTARVVITGQLTFISLSWNLFLAWIPYALTCWMPAICKSRWSFAALFCLWLLFVPNSFYILTDLFHLGSQNNVPLWYDLALINSFAWNGLLLGVLSVRKMEKLVQTKQELLFIYPIMFLNALGVYIGRYYRYNSWDVVTNPFALLKDILHIIINPIQHKDVWGMTICYSVFMTLVYLTLKRLSR